MKVAESLRIIKKEKDLDKKCIGDVLEYYRISGRHDMPWRKNINPYRILVSEIMLQQTQVSRVVPKFKVWMKSFPTLSALSQSTLQDVLILWQGLGYQRRAKALFEIAKKNKRIPGVYEELLLLEGVGVYTASALCAFAYNIFSHPVLETNIRTVLIEYFHVNEVAVHDEALYDDLTRLIEYKKVKSLGARAWYYALMDYGAYLKSVKKISHNTKSAHHTAQSVYKGSFRQLRASVLFAIAHREVLPEDERVSEVLESLVLEGYIVQNGKEYRITQ